MGRIALPLVFLLLAPCGASTQDEPQADAQARAETPTFPAQVERVTVDVVVTDKKGQPVTDLSRDDFVLTEDGTPQSIASLEAFSVPAAPPVEAPPTKPRVSTNAVVEHRADRSFIILFDDVHLEPVQARRAKVAVAEFLRNGTREGDRVTLISSSGNAWWATRMAGGRDELITLLKRLEGQYVRDRSPDRLADYEAMRIHVFTDQATEDRVRRRWDTYGVTEGDRTGRVGRDPVGDPLVRARAAEVYLDSVTRSRVTLDLMKRVLDSLTATKGRKSMILISAGFIYDPSLDEFKQVTQASRRANCAIYFLDTRGLGGLPDFVGAEFGPAIDSADIGPVIAETLEASAGSENLASDSGGFSVRNTNDLGKGIERIANESRAYYLLGYQSTNTRMDGRFRHISVKVNRKGVDVRARKGYYAPVEGSKNVAGGKKAPQVDPAFQQAIDSPYEMSGIPLRETAYVFDETLLGKARVLVTADVDIGSFAFEEKDGRLHDTLEFLLLVTHRETGEPFQYDQKVELKLLAETREKLLKTGFPIVRDFELAPGGYQAKLVARDKGNGRIGTIVHEFEVPDLAQFRASTPILGDTLAQPNIGSQGPPHLLPTAAATFAQGSSLFCQYEVYGATKDKATGMPKVSAGFALRKSDGTVLLESAPTPMRPTSMGKLSRLLRAPLEAAAPGDYELVLSLRGELAGKTIELHEPFAVRPAG